MKSIQALIEKKRFDFITVREHGMYAPEYVESLRKQYLGEIVGANMERLNAQMEAHNAKLDAIKAKYVHKPVDPYQLHLHELQLRSLSDEELKDIAANVTKLGMEPEKIFALGAELRGRDPKASDRLAVTVKAGNLMEPHKNSPEYEDIQKEGAFLKLQLNAPERLYEGEGMIITGIRELGKALD